MSNINWASYLTRVDPTNSSSHSWICEIEKKGNQGSTYSIEIISHDEYQSYISNGTSNGKYVQRLTLSEIVSRTQTFVEQKLANLQISVDQAERLIETAVHLNDVFGKTRVGKTYEENLMDTLDSVKCPEADELQGVADILKKMIKRASNKKTPLPKSLWEKIVCFVRSIFFNKQAYLKDIEKTIHDLSNRIPNYNSLIDCAISDLKDRIDINIEVFRKNVINDTSPRMKYDTVDSIKKVWLVHNHPDKFITNSESADTARNRIIQMYNVWKNLNNLKTNAKLPSDRPSASSTYKQLSIENILKI